MSWNPVLNKFIEIKNTYKNKIGEPTYSYKSGYTDESKTCLERWVEELIEKFPDKQFQQYEELISCLEMNQWNQFLIIRYARYSNVYDGEIESSGEDFWDRYNGFYRECRSVVIDVVNDKIVLAPFKKFFNINELEETRLENVERRIATATNVEFSNKLDGSMQSATWYDGRIIMAGSQAIDPSNSWRLQEGYRMLDLLPGYKRMLIEHPGLTFIFEYISLKDAHVVKYKKEQEGLYLIGVRNNNDGRELPYRSVLDVAYVYNIPTTEIFDKTLDQVMAELDEKSSDEAEGFVINIDGYKVKVKYNDYVYIHKALSKLSSINLIIKSIADDTFDDLLSKLPEAYHDNVKRVANIVFNYICDTENIIRKYYDEAPKNDKKKFMIWVDSNVPKKYRGFCRSLYLGDPINVLKKHNGSGYLKLKDMGIEDYGKLFVNNENE